jgi:hypothetical protein
VLSQMLQYIALLLWCMRFCTQHCFYTSVAAHVHVLRLHVRVIRHALTKQVSFCISNCVGISTAASCLKLNNNSNMYTTSYCLGVACLCIVTEFISCSICSSLASSVPACLLLELHHHYTANCRATKCNSEEVCVYSSV